MSGNYNISSYDPIAGGTSISAAISDAGEIVGTVLDTQNNLLEFTEIGGTVSIINDNGATTTDVTAVNAGGSFVGYSLSGAGLAGPRWFVADPGGPITDFTGNGTIIQPTAINAAGVVVGTDGTNGFSAVDGFVSVISVASSTGTTVTGVNAGGEIVGYYNDTSGAEHGFTLLSGTTTTIDPAGSTGTEVTAINDGGTIAGNYADTSGDIYGFVDSGGMITSVDPDNSQFVLVTGLNDSGIVVGDYLGAAGVEHGFVQSGGVVTTIDPAGSVGTIVDGINNVGQIVGTYDDASGGEHTFVATPACYCPGTMITTHRGEVPVENLAIGDRVTTVSGADEPIRWIGRRSYAGRFLRSRPSLLPVRITAGALGGGLPYQDLVVSPAHALLLQGVLVPTEELVNGISILREAAIEQVDYIHIELAHHDVIWANGTPAETFVDDHSRAMFTNAAEFYDLYPDSAPVEALYCAPRISRGYQLDRIRNQLLPTAA